MITTQALALGIILLLFLSINMLLIRYILVPLFSKPILLQSEILPFLETQNCLYISHSVSQKYIADTSKRNFLENIFSITTKYDVIAFSNNKNNYTQFNVLVTKYNYPYFRFKRNNFLTKRTIQFIEEKDETTISKVNDLYTPKIKKVENTCPACGDKISKTATQCNSCGIHFSS